MRRQALLALLLGLTPGAWAGDQIISSGSSGNLNTGSASYNCIMGAGLQAWTTTLDHASRQIITTGGTLRKLKVELLTNPGAAKSYTFALMLNGSATALTCAISGGSATTCEDTSNTVAVVAGDIVAMRSTPSGGPTSTSAKFCLMFSSTTVKETLLLGNTKSTEGEMTTARNQPLHGKNTPRSNEMQTQLPVPTTGTVKRLYVNLEGAPGAGDTAVYTVRKNGADTALTCTIADTATACNDTTNSFTVVAGDLINLRRIGTGTPSAWSNTGTGSVTFLTDTDGEFVIGASSSGNAFAIGATEYGPVSGGDYNPGTTETDHQNGIQASTLKSMRIKLSGSPGTGKSYLFTVRKDLGDTVLACTVADAATTCTDTENVSAVDFELLDFSSVPSGTPTGQHGSMGLLGFINPAVVSSTVMQGALLQGALISN